jgi:hypothetical protein
VLPSKTMGNCRRLSPTGCLVALLLAPGCGHEWDAYDPRDASGAGGIGAAGSGAGAGASGSVGGAGGASGGTGSAAGPAAGGAGNGGGSPDPPDLVAAYGLDEGAGTTVFDATSNDNDGTIAGATWVTGQHGGALSFDGQGDLARIPADPSWQKEGALSYTIEAWIKVTVPGLYTGAIAVGPWTAHTASLGVYEDSWAFNVAMVGGPNDYQCGAESGSLSYLLDPDGQFHHVAGVLDAAAGECSLYLDGALVATDTYVDGAANFGGGDLILGGFDGSNYLGCEIDDVRIYTRALSADEIALDMATPIAP